MSAGLAKSTGYIGKSLRELLSGKKYDPISDGKVGRGVAPDKTGKDLNPTVQKQYADYHAEVNATRLGTPETPKVVKTGKAETVEVKQVKEEPAKLGTVKEESPKIGSNLSGTTSKISNGKILGAVGLTGAVATAGTFLGLNYLPSIFDPNGGGGGGDPSIIEKIKEVFSELIGGGGGGTYYLEGDPYGESGSVTVLDETVETLKEYAPYLIGFGVIVVIVALVTGNRKGKGKKGGNRK